MSPFKAGVVLFFGVLAVSAVFIFATFSGSARQNIGVVEIWGVVSEDVMDEVLGELRIRDNSFGDVSYRQFPADTFSETLTEAIATGVSPDLVLVENTDIVQDGTKFQPISFRTVSRRDFQDTFVESSEIFLSPNGALGLPFYIDPLVLFWNRTLFSQAGVARPPNYWDEINDIAPTLTRSNESGTITQAAVGIGEWGNIRHAKDIFLSLIIGLGNDVVVVGENGELQSTLSAQNEEGVSAAESALRFYTDFADPVKVVYSWNRSLPESRALFLAGDLAMYFGRASDTFALREANPNLNFDVAEYPEVRGGFRAVPTQLYALAIPRGSENPGGALQVAITLSGLETQQSLVSLTGLPSVRRDVLSVSPDNQYETIFRNAALNSFSFLDPNPRTTDGIFERMVEDVSSGRARLPEAVLSGHNELKALLDVQ